MKPQYRSPKSVAKNQTIPIDVNDPRLKRLNQGKTIARSGAEILPIDFNKNSLLAISAARGSGFGSQSSTSAQVGGQIDREQLPDIQPGVISNLSVSWDGKNLNFSFNFDPNTEENKYATNFRVYAEAGPNVNGYSPTEAFPINKNQTSHTLVFTEEINRKTFGTYHSNITSFCVAAIDVKGVATGFNVCVVPSVFVTSLAAPQISVSSKNQGYAVEVTNTSELAKSEFSNLEIWEIESNDLSAPAVVYASDGITPTNYTRIYASSVVPALVVTINLNKRWVMARFGSNAGVFSTFSSIYSVTPTSPVNVDLTPPNEVTINTVAWSNDDITINYSLPVTEEGYQFQIVLTALDSSVGYFYDLPALHNTTSPQTLTILKNQIFGQFGQYYSSYTGIFKSIDPAGNRSSGVSFNVPTKANPLSGITPTFDVVRTANGYIVTWTPVSGSTYADIYENSVSWGGTNPIDESLRVYAGQSPALVQSLNYSTRYIKIRLYDDYGNTSNYSAEQTVVPYDPGALSIINNPVTFSTEGSILAGSGVELNPKVIFNQDGIFAYDASGNSTTQILNNAAFGDVTFITEYAQIADWTISPTKIENNLYGAADTYTGLSASGTYAFWAGSPTAGGSALSKFWVKPDGSVQAKNIAITGGSLDVGGGVFQVTSGGALTATSASITGAITATSGSFTGNLFIGTSGSIYSGTVVPGTPPTLSGQGFILNNEGLRFNSPTTQGVTTIDGASGLFTTTSANIGGWNVTSAEIKRVAPGGGQIILSSNANSYGAVYVQSSNGAKTSGILSSNTGSSGEIAIWAGDGTPSTVNTTKPPFYVTIDGNMQATDAIITGEIKNQKTSVEDAFHPGFYTNSLGELLVGGGHQDPNKATNNFTGLSFIQIKDTSFTLETADNGRIVLNVGGTNRGTNGLYVSGITLDNADYSKNDVTMVAVVHDNTGANGPYKVTRGRRFYWGFGYTPTEAESWGDSYVADISYAQAGDIFFSTAS